MTRADLVGTTLRSTETFVSRGHLNELLQQRASRTSIQYKYRFRDSRSSTPGRSTCTNLGRTRHFLPRTTSSAFKSTVNPSRSSAPLGPSYPTLYESSRETNHSTYTPYIIVFMSDTMDLQESGLQEVANAMREDGGSQKRKRESESADDTRRGNKRVSPLSKAGDHDEALHDYANMHGDQNGADHANASSTAAAALAGIYPTMTIPQPTDVSFATQGSDNDRGESSFMDNSQAGDSFMEQSTPSGRGSGNKPAVGSEEWHKVRKDNHKEGKQSAFYFQVKLKLTGCQSSVVVARPLTRVSMSWPRSSRAVRRIRDPFSNVPSPSSHNSRRTKPRTSRNGLLRNS